MSSSSSPLKDDIKAEAFRLGFTLVGVTTPVPPLHAETFLQWIADGKHAGMDYLASPRSLLCRPDPRQVLPEAASIIVLAVPYANPVSLPVQTLPEPAGRVASYAWGNDYHEVLEPRLRQLVEWIERATGRSILQRCYTDTGPILERDLAMQAGLGWTGKNTCLIHPRLGSYFLLSEILLDTPLEPDPPFTTDQCGSCRRCIEACPTRCIDEDRTIDSGRCISYLTIENKGPIQPELRPQVGSWVFGCDICQMVCPWNIRFAHLDPDPQFAPQPGRAAPNLHTSLRMSIEEFRKEFRDSPIRRAKRRGYLRNIAVALGNQGDPESVPHLRDTLSHEAEPLVRGHAAWALGRIGSRPARAALQQALRSEVDETVRAEIRSALGMTG